MVRLCGMWRPEAWWRNPFSKLHHRAGTPHIKWEHVFVINFGLNWQKEMFKEDWNQREEEFIDKALKKLNPKVVTKSAAANQDEVAERVAAKKKQKEENAEGMPEEQEEKAPEEKLGWQAANDGTLRLELAGDSILVTRWCNGHWPVRNKGLGEIMEGCKERLVKMLSTFNVRPRCNGTDFVRHQKRKWNKECDHLAGLGKEETAGKLVIAIMDGGGPGKYWKGAWDGGYNPGEKQVGIGYKVWTSDEMGHTAAGKCAPINWKEKCAAFGAVAGEGAIFAESVAFECLVFSVQCLVSGKEIDAKERLGKHTEVRHQNWSNPMTSSLEKAVRTLFGRKHDIDKREAIDKRMRTGLDMQQSQQSSGGEDDRPAFLRLLD